MNPSLNKKLTIPKNWTGEEAKIVWEFLEDVINAIWQAHFYALDEAVKKEKATLEHAASSNSKNPFTEDDFPF